MKRAILAILLVAALGAPAAADFQAGLDAYNRRDYPAALREWRPLAQAGNPDAQFNIGLLYEHGLGVPKDLGRAFRWYAKAAAENHALAGGAVGRFERDHADVVRRERAEAQRRAQLERLRQDRIAAREQAARARRARPRTPGFPVPDGWARAADSAAAGTGGDGIPDARGLFGAETARELYLPPGETLADWSEIIVVDTVDDTAQPDPAAIADALIANVIAGCEKGDGPDPERRLDRGLLTIESLYACTRVKGRDYGSFTRLAVIPGEGVVRVVRRAWRGKPFAADAIDDIEARFDPWDDWFDRAATAEAPRAQPTGHRRAGGFGFYVSRRGHVLTTFKAVKDCKRVRFSSGTGILVAANPDKNLAVYRVRKQPDHVATFRKDGAAGPGETVVVASDPGGGQAAAALNVSTGSVAAAPETSPGASGGSGSKTLFLPVTVAIQPGLRGAPLLDLRANVVGILMARPGDTPASSAGGAGDPAEVALRAEVATAFLAGLAVPLETEPKARILSPAEVGERARAITLTVNCRR